jgi:hypothetical protein
VHQVLLTSVQEVGDCRRKRILALHSTWTQQLMPLLLSCSAIVMAFAYLYARRGAIFHGVLICFVAIALGGNLGLVFVLRNPFAGDWKIQPRGFLLNNQLLKTINNEPELRNLLNAKDDVRKDSDKDTDKDNKAKVKASKNDDGDKDNDKARGKGKASKAKGDDKDDEKDD